MFKDWFLSVIIRVKLSSIVAFVCWWIVWAILLNFDAAIVSFGQVGARASDLFVLWGQFWQSNQLENEVTNSEAQDSHDKNRVVVGHH